MAATSGSEARPSGHRPGQELRDGRYTGGDDAIELEMRVDTRGLGIVSADLYRRLGEGRALVASLRTFDEPAHPLGGEWSVAVLDTLGEEATGRLALTPSSSDGEVEGWVWLDSPLNGLPSERELAFTASWQGEDLRRLGVEIDRERGVAELPRVEHRGRALTLEACLAEAGFRMVAVGEHDEIPAPDGGWELAQLHTLLGDFAQAPLERPDWNVHVMLLSRSSERTRGLLGVMFDLGAVLPRQGVAVFADEIDAGAGDDRARKLLQTSLHEIGHALNLAHRFDQDVGRADSASHMNYDWRFRGGRSHEEFWEQYAFAFDDDELAFLRHGPRGWVVPGGAPYRSVSYWADAAHDYAPFLPDQPHEGLVLTLHAPEAGRLFRYGQPVYLRTRLENRTDRPVTCHARLLDVRAGFLDVFVQRHASGRSTAGAAAGWKSTGWKSTGWKSTGWKSTGWKSTGWKSTGWKSTALAGAASAGLFVPVAPRCYDIADSGRRVLQPGKAVEDNVNLAYGSAGFLFTEPGDYDIIPLLFFTDTEDGREWIVLGKPLTIRVAHPYSLEEEQDALTLFDDDVGVFFVLGGSETLHGAREKLLELRDRRGDQRGHPTLAAVLRTLSLDRRRAYVRFRDGGYTVAGGRPDEAADLLDQLDDQALTAFDAVTANETRTLRGQLRAAANG